jgi:predicted RNA-binding protein YlxR (DUF448 family)
MRTSFKRQTVAVKHTPQRTCVACQEVRAKRELIRLVRVSDGSVQVDTSGKKAGRGAYLCRVAECWEKGLKGNRLEHILRTTITPDNWEELADRGKEILQGVN